MRRRADKRRSAWQSGFVGLRVKRLETMPDTVLHDRGADSNLSTTSAMGKEMGLKSDLLSGTSVLGALAQAAHLAPGSRMRVVADLLSTTDLVAGKCRGCGVTITPANDSKAHILPNALAVASSRKASSAAHATRNSIGWRTMHW
jgi:hypothetical protein